MKKMLALFVISTATIFLGCESKEAKKAKLDAIGFKYVQDIVKNEFRDPESTQFRNQKGFCGEVNTKNGMGGYVGFQKFVLLNPKTVLIENEANVANKQFQKAWGDICVKDFSFNENKLTEPNFKVSDPEYDAPKYTVENGSITATPKSLVMKEGVYIYPKLSVTCLDSKTRFILLSYKSPSYDNNGLISLLSEDIDSMILIPFSGDEWIQEFYSNGSAYKLLKNSKDLTIYFKSNDGGNSMQTYNMTEIRKRMKMQSNGCNWSDL